MAGQVSGSCSVVFQIMRADMVAGVLWLSERDFCFCSRFLLKRCILEQSHFSGLVLVEESGSCLEVSMADMLWL